jgi:hypothetical protein
MIDREFFARSVPKAALVDAAWRGWRLRRHPRLN